VIFSAKLSFFFLLSACCGCFSSVAVCFSHAAEEEDQAEWREKKKQGTSRASHAPFLVQFLVCLATKIVAFFIKIADFALMGPVGLLAAVAQLFTATSMV
jgi:hypothetical protein